MAYYPEYDDQKRESQQRISQYGMAIGGPPEYSSAIRFDGSRAGSFAVRNDGGGGVGSGRDAAYDDGRSGMPPSSGFARPYAGGEGGGGGFSHDLGYRQADTPPDTPSQYTDPHEYATVVGAHTEPNFLAHDPYAQRAAAVGGGGGDHELGRQGTIRTIAPSDSISAYNVPARSRQVHPLDDYVSTVDDTRDLGRLNAQSHDSHAIGHAYGNSFDFQNTNDDDYAYNNPQDTYYGDPSGGNRGGYWQQGGPSFDASRATLPLKDNAGFMGYADDEEDEKRRRDQYWNGASKGDWERNNEHPPALFSNNMQGPPVPPHGYEDGGHADDDRRGLLGSLMTTGKGGSGPQAKAGWGGSVEEQIERRRAGVGRQRWPMLSWLLSVAYVVVFIIELVKAKSATGQAIQTKPSINPMIGPPYEFLIAFGARFVPCMRSVPDLPLSTPMICLKDTALPTVSSSNTCPLYEICGLPNANTFGQSWRFITPIFVHAGFVHIAFNLLAQLTLCAQMEKIISTPLYAIVYVAGGIGGNLLGGNFGLVGLPSVGASGAIYACISLELIDLLYNWKYEYRPKTRLVASIGFTIIGLAIGLLPGLDNFAHIGGFAVGLLGAMILGPSIHETQRHRVVTWVLRVIAAALLVGFFVALSLNFYNSSDPRKACTWCRYLSCLPTFSQCKGNGLTTSTTTPAS